MFAIILFTCIITLPLVFYLYAIHETIKLVQKKHRTLAPWQVWLGLIPFLNLIWQYLIVANLMDSLSAEFRFRKAKYPLKKMKQFGTAYCILIFFSIIPSIGFFLGLAGLVCFIIFWMKVVDVKKRLKLLPLDQEFGKTDF